MSNARQLYPHSHNRCLANGKRDWQDLISVSLELVTPADAKQMLSGNTGNYRKIIPTNKSKIVSDMRKGRFSFTNNTIAFDVDSTLTDGQHRLEAIVESGTSQWFLIVRGMPIGAKDNPATDTGARRSVGQHLSRRSIVNANVVASIARFLLTLRQGGKKRSGGMIITDTEIAEAVEKDDFLLEAGCVAINSDARKAFTPSVLGTWYWLAIHENRPLAEKCFRIVSGKEDVVSSDPFLRCKEQLLVMKANKAQKIIDPDYQLRLILAAWEKSRNGESCKLLRPLSIVKLSDKSDEALQQFGV